MNFIPEPAYLQMTAFDIYNSLINGQPSQIQHLIGPGPLSHADQQVYATATVNQNTVKRILSDDNILVGCFIIIHMGVMSYT